MRLAVLTVAISLCACAGPEPRRPSGTVGCVTRDWLEQRAREACCWLGGVRPPLNYLLRSIGDADGDGVDDVSLATSGGGSGGDHQELFLSAGGCMRRAGEIELGGLPVLRSEKSGGVRALDVPVGSAAEPARQEYWFDGVEYRAGAVRPTP